jgi:hypothetical protein
MRGGRWPKIHCRKQKIKQEHDGFIAGCMGTLMPEGTDYEEPKNQ